LPPDASLQLYLTPITFIALHVGARGWRSNALLRKPMIGSPSAGEAMLDIAPTTIVPEP
jgi:hypothetical protein